MTSTSTTQPAPSGPETSSPNKWVALGVIAVAQLMVALDATIVNVALPRPSPRSASTTPSAPG
jgi:hypothetical protein